MQAHGLGMTPVSIKQLRELLYNKSQQELKKQSETKLGGSLKYNGEN